jgi:hypothetical protein
MFQTRWTMSYLRGPLTRTEIRKLAQECAGETVTPTAARRRNPKRRRRARAPCFHRISRSSSWRSRRGPVVYQPMLLGSAQVHFIDKKTKVDVPYAMSWW